MQGRLTWSLFLAAVCLFALIFFFERKLPTSAESHAPKSVLPIATADQIQKIEVILPPAALVSALKTNGLWTLIEPRYPARQLAIDTFATNLVQLRAFDQVPPHEVKLQGEKAFGLAPPRATVQVTGASNSFELEIGGISPLTSNLYVRVTSSGDVLLVNPDLLAALPRTTNDWRTPALFQLSSRDFDHIVLHAGQRSFELGRGTNNAWQISKPVPARADQDRVLELLQVLRTAEATAFISDSPGPDLDRFGLQSPAAELSFTADTNRVFSISFGNSPTNNTNQVFALLLGQTNVVLVPRELEEYLKQPYKAYHDPRLIAISPAALDRVVVHAIDNFTLQRQPQGTWRMDGPSGTLVDRELFQRFVSTVSAMRIVDIVKEVPAEADLQALGFIPPAGSYSFYQKFTNASGIATNILVTDLTFGHAQGDTIFVRRSDENPVYQTPVASVVELPKRAFELRDRRIWRFPTNDVLTISLSSGGRTNKLSRSPGGWSADPIANAQIEETIFRLAHLNAQEWVERGAPRLPVYGLNDDSLILVLEVRTSSGNDHYTLHFGRLTLRKDVYASIIFPDEREPLIFEFPGDLYQILLQALPVPK